MTSNGDTNIRSDHAGVRPVDTAVSTTNLRCKICNNLLSSPRQSAACGHRFCADCLERSFKTTPGNNTPFKCPACGVIVGEEEHFPDAYADRELMALDVFCAASQQGCQWRGHLKSYSAHQQTCPYVPVGCPLGGCSARMPRHQLQHHHDTVCVGREIACESCGEAVAMLQLDQHAAEKCPKATVTCANACGATDVVRSEMAAHLRTCPKVKVRCYYASAGCEFHGYRGDLPSHHSNNVAYHMQIIHQISETTRQNMKEVRHDCTKLRQQLVEVEEKNGTLTEQVAQLSQDKEALNQEIALLRDTSVDQQKDLLNEKRSSADLAIKVESVALMVERMRGDQEFAGVNGGLPCGSKGQPQFTFPTATNDSSTCTYSAAQTNGFYSPSPSPHATTAAPKMAASGDSEAIATNMCRRSSMGRSLACLPAHQPAQAQLPSATQHEVVELRKTTASLGKRIDALDRTTTVQDIQLSDLSIRQDLIEVKGSNGVLVWRIADIGRRLQEAVSGRTVSLYSPPFFTSQSGYKMCARIYLNGDGAGKSTHVSLFFVIMRGDFDALLPWPFQQRVKMALLDQTSSLASQRRNDVTEVFRPNVTSSSFQRPTSEMNIATGCPLFAPKSALVSDRYVQDDTIFLKIEVGNLGPKAPDFVHGGNA